MGSRRFGADTGLTVRMGTVLLLLLAVYVGFLAFMAAYGFDFIFLLIVAVVMLVAQFFFADKLVLRVAGAREVGPEAAPDLHARIERLAAQMDLPKPKIAVMDTDVPNAFATGRSPSASVVAVSTGLMRRLDDRELEGVLAHELSHIANRDVMVMTLAGFFSMVAFLLAEWLWRWMFFSAMFGGYRRRDNSGQMLMLVWVVAILVGVVSMLLLRALSRYREHAADRGAALTTGQPSALASALQKISGAVARIPQQDLREIEGASAFFIIPLTSKEWWANLISTHPPLEERLSALERIQAEMERS